MFKRVFIGTVVFGCLMIGCANTLAPAPDTPTNMSPTSSGVPKQATACPTKTPTARASSVAPGTAQPGSSTAPAGQSGQVSPGAGAGTPNPEQIATSRAMLDQSNRDGPPIGTPEAEITPDAQPSGPGVAPPDQAVAPPGTPGANENGTAQPEPTHYESQQPYPDETSANPCP